MADLDFFPIENYPPVLDEVYTAVEAARLWGLSDSTVQAAIRKDLVPARKSIGTWLIAKSTMMAHWGPMPPAGLIKEN